MISLSSFWFNFDHDFNDEEKTQTSGDFGGEIEGENRINEYSDVESPYATLDNSQIASKDSGDRITVHGIQNETSTVSISPNYNHFVAYWNNDKRKIENDNKEMHGIPTGKCKATNLKHTRKSIEQVIDKNELNHLDEDEAKTLNRQDSRRERETSVPLSDVSSISLSDENLSIEYSKSLFFETSEDLNYSDETKNNIAYASEKEPIETNNDIQDLLEVITQSSLSLKPSKRFTLKRKEQEALIRHRKHFSFVAYGRWLTFAAVLPAIIGIIFSIATERSSSFFHLKEEIRISRQLDAIENIGLLRVKLCYNQTMFYEKIWSYENDSLVHPFTSAPTAMDYRKEQLTGCFDLKLSGEAINDIMWDLSLSFLYLAISLGSFSTIMLCLAICWESINLQPIAISLLLTYFFQSMSFASFDSELCKEHECVISQGSICSIVASICWFLSGITCIRMDFLYHRKHRRWDRRRKRALKKLELQRKHSGATIATAFSDENKGVNSPKHSLSNLPIVVDNQGLSTVDVEEWKGDVGVLIENKHYSV